MLDGNKTKGEMAITALRLLIPRDLTRENMAQAAVANTAAFIGNKVQGFGAIK